MKASGRMIKKMEKESFRSQTDINMMASGMLIKEMGKQYFINLMV